MIDIKGNWVDHITLIEFVYNISYIRESKCIYVKLFTGEGADLLLGSSKLVKKG